MITDTELGEARAEAAVVAEVTARSVEPKALVEGSVWALTEGVRVEDLTEQLRKYEDRPARRRGTVAAHDAESLSRLVSELGPQHGEVRIYADVLDTNPKVTALLNDHQAADDDDLAVAGWGDHRIVLEIRRTPAWQDWLKLDRKMIDQVAFAQHLEDHLSDIAAPDGADLLEMALTFEQTTAAEFRTAVRLNDGNRQLTYTETTDQQAGRSGQLTIPEWITLAVSPFEGSEQVRVEARLRTFARDGNLTIGYRIDRPEEVERNALDSIVEEIQTATEITPFRAKPPTS